MSPGILKRRARGTGMPIRQICLDCRALTANGSRCESCEGKRQAYRNASRPHYRGDYARRARKVRDAAAADPSTMCWLCGEPARADDPWTADHVVPGEPSSPLMPAHRSCNSARGDGRGRRAETAFHVERRA